MVARGGLYQRLTPWATFFRRYADCKTAGEDAPDTAGLEASATVGSRIAQPRARTPPIQPAWRPALQSLRGLQNRGRGRPRYSRPGGQRYSRCAIAMPRARTPPIQPAWRPALQALRDCNAAGEDAPDTAGLEASATVAARLQCRGRGRPRYSRPGG